MPPKSSLNNSLSFHTPILDDIDEMPPLESELETGGDTHHHHTSDCNHSHSGHSHHCKHHHEDGDGFTQMTKWIEASTALFVYSYVWGMATDNFIGAENKKGVFEPIDYVGISVPSLILGILLATWAAWGSAKSHQNLNAMNEDGLDEHLAIEDLSEETRASEVDNSSDMMTVIDVNTSNAIQPHKLTLSKTQKAALIGDLIAHTAEVVATITLVIDNVTKKYNLSSTEIRVWQGATVAFSLAGSLANVRACKNSMLEEQDTAAQHNNADLLTWMGLIAEGVSLGLGNADWLAETITDCANLTKDVFEVSWIGFGVGIGVSLLTVAASGYAHTLTNINYQTNLQPTKKQVQSTPLTTVQKAIQPLDYLTHIGAYTPRVDFVVERVLNAAKHNEVPLHVRRLVHAASFLIGFAGAYADWRACKNNVKKYNFNNRNTLFQPAEQELMTTRSSQQNLRESFLTPEQRKEDQGRIMSPV